jgi:hypothetical protein
MKELSEMFGHIDRSDINDVLLEIKRDTSFTAVELKRLAIENLCMILTIQNPKIMKRHFAFLGIRDVTEVTDSSWYDLDKAYKKIRSQCDEAGQSEGKTKLLVYVYASTHGFMYDGSPKT